MVADPTFYIAFEPAKTDPFRLSANAPKACKIDYGSGQKDAADAQKLNDAFATQLGSGAGFAVAKFVSVTCSGS